MEETSRLPEGVEWPRYESGDLVMFGDCVENRNGTCTVNSVRFYSGGGVTVYGEDRGSRLVVVTEPVMHEPIRKARPKVFAADGEPLEVGQTVWDVEDGKEFEVVNVNGELPLLKFGETAYTATEPEHLTHQRPVLDADGVPIRKGDTVWHKGTGEKYRVFRFSAIENCVWGESDLGSFFLDCSMLTHTKPDPSDTWERIEEDATLSPEVYCHRNGIDISQKDGTEIFLADTVEPMACDLVRRCKEVARKENNNE